MQSGYLHRLPIRPAKAGANGSSRARQRIRLAGIVVMLALLSISSLAAIAFERLVAGAQNDVLPGLPAVGCRSASLEPRGAQVMIGKASLCRADGGVHSVVDLENLGPNARYIVWIVYRRNGRLCDPDPRLPQLLTPTRLCTLTDFEDPADPVLVRAVAETTAADRGIFHIDEPIRAINLEPRSYVWLMVARPQWSPVPHPTYRLVEDDPTMPVARAVLEVP